MTKAQIIEADALLRGGKKAEAVAHQYGVGRSTLFRVSEAWLDLERVRMEKQAEAEVEVYTRKVDITNQMNLELVKAEFQGQYQLPALAR